MLKKRTLFTYLFVGMVFPLYMRPVNFFGKNIPHINIPHIDVQHTMEPLEMNPITIDPKSLSTCVRALSTSLSGTACAAAGAYLFSVGIKHALCNDTPQPQSASTSWIKNKHIQGLITSCVGAAAFLGGLYIIGNYEAVLNSMKK